MSHLRRRLWMGWVDNRRAVRLLVRLFVRDLPEALRQAIRPAALHGEPCSRLRQSAELFTVAGAVLILILSARLVAPPLPPGHAALQADAAGSAIIPTAKRPAEITKPVPPPDVGPLPSAIDPPPTPSPGIDRRETATEDPARNDAPDLQLIVYRAETAVPAQPLLDWPPERAREFAGRPSVVSPTARAEAPRIDVKPKPKVQAASPDPVVAASVFVSDPNKPEASSDQMVPLAPSVGFQDAGDRSERTQAQSQAVSANDVSSRLDATAFIEPYVREPLPEDVPQQTDQMVSIDSVSSPNDVGRGSDQMVALVPVPSPNDVAGGPDGTVPPAPLSLNATADSRRGPLPPPSASGPSEPNEPPLEAVIDVGNHPQLGYAGKMIGRITTRKIWDGRRFITQKVCVVEEGGGIRSIWILDSDKGATASPKKPETPTQLPPTRDLAPMVPIQPARSPQR